MSQSIAFSILMILLSKRHVSREYLAERFSVSKRTVSRYLTVLEDAGVPIVSTPGRGGGVALSDDYIVDKSFLSEAETLRIKDALRRTLDCYDDKANGALIEKLDAVDKSREADTYVIKQDNLYIDCDYEQSDDLRPKIKTLNEAIDQVRSVEIKYTDSHGYVSYRTIEPYTLVFKEAAWYVYAMCKLRGDFRLFRLSRITDLRMTSKRFIKYESKLVEKLELEFYNEIYVDLEFEFFPSIYADIVDWLGLRAVSERGAKMIAHAEVPLTDRLIKRLLGFGSSIKVLNPVDVRDSLREEARRMTDLYSD